MKVKVTGTFVYDCDVDPGYSLAENVIQDLERNLIRVYQQDLGEWYGFIVTNVTEYYEERNDNIEARHMLRVEANDLAREL